MNRDRFFELAKEYGCEMEAKFLWDGRPSRPSPEITEDEEWVREAFKHIGPTAAIPQACQDYLKEYNNDETQQAGETGN